MLLYQRLNHYVLLTSDPDIIMTFIFNDTDVLVEWNTLACCPTIEI